MISKISQFFHQLTLADSTENSTELSPNLACAVMLVEVMNADGQIEATERAEIERMLITRFDLSQTDAEELLHLATQQAEKSTDLFKFTHLINQTFSIEQKINLVKMLWQVADADGKISSIEHHVIRKIADLLHLRHHEYIESKSVVSSSQKTQ